MTNNINGNWITWLRAPVYSNEEDEDQMAKAATDDSRSCHRTSAPSGPTESRIERLRRSMVVPFPRKHDNYRDPRAFLGELEDRDMVHFLAGGQRLSCPERVLLRYPESMLGDPVRRGLYYKSLRKFHDFSTTLPDVFTAVLEFYEGAALVRPDRLTVDYFLEQLEIFELEQDILDKYVQSEGIKVPKRPPSRRPCRQSLKQKSWEFVRYPQVSRLSRCFGVLSLLITTLSVTLHVLETVPKLRFMGGENGTLSDAFQNPFYVVNTICYIFFTMEFLLWLYCCPTKVRFFRKWYHWVDLASIFAHFGLMLMMGLYYREPPLALEDAFRAMRLFRILKLLGITKTTMTSSQYWTGILWQTMKNNASTLLVLLFLLLICMILFAGIAYAIEGGPEDTFKTIPYAFWWALMTMTTVGYGDISPAKAGGQFVAVICGSVGVILLALLLYSISSEYHKLTKNTCEYRRYRARCKVRRILQRCKSESHVFRNTSSGEALHDNEISVLINGAQFILKLSDLSKFPATLLGDSTKRQMHYLNEGQSMFFARSIDVFSSIAAFYSSGGDLRRPPFVSMRRFVEELSFYQLGEKALIDLFASEGIRLVKELEPEHPVARFWYRVLEHPEYNMLSRFTSFLTIAIITLSVITLVLESLPAVLSASCLLSLAPMKPNTTSPKETENSENALVGRFFNQRQCKEENTFFILESVCTLWYTLELVIRFILTPSKMAFIKSVMNWVDVLTIVPYVFTLVEEFSKMPDSFIVINSFGALRTIRLIRLLALLKFSRFSKTMQMILQILRSAWFELAMSFHFIFVMAVLFGTVTYFFEYDNSVQGGAHAIDSIPRGIYWSWITMLTIGYGDYVPKTTCGFITGGVCAITGMLFWSLPMTLVADHYATYRQLYRDQEFMISMLGRLERAREKHEADNDLVHALDLVKPPLALPSESVTLPASSSSANVGNLGGFNVVIA